MGKKKGPSIMIVYHGGTDIIEEPLVHLGRPKLDFGPGFYVTALREQAVSWANKIADRRGSPALVNKYYFDQKGAMREFKYMSFGSYDREWLDFVVNNRLGRKVWKQFDIVEGGVADDRVIDTVELYMGGYLTEEQAIGRLKYYSPNHQICFINQQVVDCHLRFEGIINL